MTTDQPPVGTRLNDIVALVTGGGQGIGRGVSLALAKEGAKVVVAGRTASKCHAVAQEITDLGGRASAVECDVTSRRQIDAAVEHTVRAFGGLTTLVNNAQSLGQTPLESVTEADIELAWSSGAMGTFHAMQSAFPHLRENAESSIINFGSAASITGIENLGAYAMAKEAIRGLSRVAATEWGQYGIRVNVVVPYAMSPATREFHAADPEAARAKEMRIPLRRVGDPESDIGSAVVGLASSDFRYLTGQTLMLNGGL